MPNSSTATTLYAGLGSVCCGITVVLAGGAWIIDTGGAAGWGVGTPCATELVDSGAAAIGAAGICEGGAVAGAFFGADRAAGGLGAGAGAVTKVYATMGGVTRILCDNLD
jgi:hypothetical protein